jgi:hypothetical protein
MAGRFRDRILVEYKIFCARPFRASSPPSLLCNRYRLSFTGVKWPGLYFYSPSGVFIACSRVNFTFTRSRIERYGRMVGQCLHTRRSSITSSKTLRNKYMLRRQFESREIELRIYNLRESSGLPTQ